MEQNSTADNTRTQISDLKQKMKFTGKVLKTSLAGAAIDIGAEKPAMLHVSQMVAENANEPIKSVAEFLNEGQEIEVWIKRIRDQRVELTMIKPLDLEWREIKKGINVKGTVVRLETFGAFVEIGAERPGLIHISEIAHGYVRTPSEVLKEGEEVEAQVIDFNRKKKQIKLSIKALQPEPEKEEGQDGGTRSNEAPPTFVDPSAFERKERPVKKKKERKQRKKSSNYQAISYNFGSEDIENEPTAMEIALRAAMEKAGSDS